MHERLSSINPENHFWKGPDVKTISDLTLTGTARVPFFVNPESLPDVNVSSPNFYNYFLGSMRSRYAQLGVDLDEHVGINLAHAIYENKGITESFYTNATLFNRSSRPIYIPKGSHLFRFYYNLPSSRVFGEDLVFMNRIGNIKIGGRFGSDWMWTYKSKDSVKDEDITGIRVRIEALGRKWIPPSPENTPISIHDTGSGYREVIDKLMVDVPEIDRRVLWIGQTKKVTLNNIEVLLDRDVLFDIKGKKEKRNGFHINSRLIDDKRTDWPIRVEVLSPTIKKQMPNFVTLHFFRRF